MVHGRTSNRTTSKYVQDSKVQFVVDAVYAFAHALHQLREDICESDSGICQSMADYNGKDFYRNYLLNVSFVGEYHCNDKDFTRN